MKQAIAAALLSALAACVSTTDNAPAGPSPDASKVRHQADIFFTGIPLERPHNLVSTPGQVYMQLLPMVGRMDRHDAEPDWPLGGADCGPPERTPGDILAEIRSRAGQTRIVIINEAHDRPQHRDYIRKVAETLRGVGYNLFAAEAFSDQLELSDEYPYALRSDGYYANEPVFGALIRGVKALGYTLLAYESRADWNDPLLTQEQKIARREDEQARNVVALLDRYGPDSHLLMHVGYAHAAEIPIPGTGADLESWMAARVRQITGIDPLTIDQTTCVSSSRRAVLYANAPRIVPGQFDMILAQPAVEFVRGRPRWRIAEGAKLVPVPDALQSDTQRVIVEARLAGERDDAVPVDRLMLWPGEDLPLLLPPGDYRLTSFLELEATTATADLTVDP